MPVKCFDALVEWARAMFNVVAHPESNSFRIEHAGVSASFAPATTSDNLALVAVEFGKVPRDTESTISRRLAEICACMRIVDAPQFYRHPHSDGVFLRYFVDMDSTTAAEFGECLKGLCEAASRWRESVAA
jgi:hypothetical protein